MTVIDFTRHHKATVASELKAPAEIIRPRAFQNGPPVRAINYVDEAMAALRIGALRAAVESSEATADDLERLERAVGDLLASIPGGLR